MNQRIIIKAVRRDSIDLDRLARALLMLVEELDPEERDRLAAEGEATAPRAKAGGTASATPRKAAS